MSRSARTSSSVDNFWRNSLRSDNRLVKTSYGEPMFSSTLRRSASAGNLRRSSSTGSLRKSGKNNAASLNVSTRLNSSLISSKTESSKQNDNPELKRIETEYIKNLQQQIYFLELETAYLREQSKKASDLQPHMVEEADKMLSKLQVMENEMDFLKKDCEEKQIALNSARLEQDRVNEKQKAGQDSHQREKRLLLEEIAQNKKEKEMLERDGSRKDVQIIQSNEEVNRSNALLRSAETKIQILNNQLEQKNDQLKISQDSLNSKRDELTKTETLLREVEDRYRSSSTSTTEMTNRHLQDELLNLQQKLKEAQLKKDNDSRTQLRRSDESSYLGKENALLNQQVLQLQTELDKEKSIKTKGEKGRSKNITNLAMSQENEKMWKSKLEIMEDVLNIEREKSAFYLDKCSNLEQIKNSVEFASSSKKSRLTELEKALPSVEMECKQLRKDKMVLVDHTADLQRKLEMLEQENENLLKKQKLIESKQNNFNQLQELQSTFRTDNWDELAKFADSMKNLTSTLKDSTDYS